MESCVAISYQVVAGGRQRIKDALNAQTYDQFLQYAQQQYPGNFDQQAILIRQLQDQHYQQYIQQLAMDQRLANTNIIDNDNEEHYDNDPETLKADKEDAKDCNLNDVEALDAMENSKSMQTSDKTEITDYAEESRGEEESDGD
ncbi:hypothetical protein evm_015640, partial [Chilo suppressalis]